MATITATQKILEVATDEWMTIDRIHDKIEGYNDDDCDGDYTNMFTRQYIAVICGRLLDQGQLESTIYESWEGEKNFLVRKRRKK